MPTFEDIATFLHGAKVFTVLDMRNGFSHVSLDENSSYLTTFQRIFLALPLETHALWNFLSTGGIPVENA